MSLGVKNNMIQYICSGENLPKEPGCSVGNFLFKFGSSSSVFLARLQTSPGCAATCKWLLDSVGNINGKKTWRNSCAWDLQEILRWPATLQR